MKAITVRPKRANSVSLQDISKPVIDKNEVLVKTLSVGIDGTDIEINQGLYGKAPAGEDKLVIGHEAVGKVVTIGEDAMAITEGDFVVPTVRRGCSSCINCKNAEPDMCESDDYKERGIVGAHGYLSQYFKEDAANLVKIPFSLVPYGSLIEPLSVAQKAVEHIFKIQERFNWRPKTAFITGAGPLGLLAAIILKKKGLDTFSYDVVEEDSQKAKVANKIGSTYVNGAKISLADLPSIYKIRPDLIIEATGNSQVAFQAINFMNKNGILCLLSVTSGRHAKTICTDCLNNWLVMGNRVVFGSVNSNKRHFKQAIDTALWAEKNLTGVLAKIITNKITLDNFQEVFEKKDTSHIKSVVYFK